MKTLFFLFLCILFSFSTLNNDDVVTLKNGEVFGPYPEEAGGYKYFHYDDVSKGVVLLVNQISGSFVVFASCGYLPSKMHYMWRKYADTEGETVIPMYLSSDMIKNCSAFYFSVYMTHQNDQDGEFTVEAYSKNSTVLLSLNETKYGYIVGDDYYLYAHDQNDMNISICAQEVGSQEIDIDLYVGIGYIPTQYHNDKYSIQPYGRPEYIFMEVEAGEKVGINIHSFNQLDGFYSISVKEHKALPKKRVGK